MEKSATVTQILLALGFLEIDSHFGQLDGGRLFANDGGAEFRNQGIHVQGSSIDRGFAGKLLVDGLPLKHKPLGLKDEQPADTRENRGALRDLVAQPSNLLFEDALLEDELSDLPLCFSFGLGHWPRLSKVSTDER
jgi:hypothetical protein